MKILIADDYEVFCLQFRRKIQELNEDDIEIIGEAFDGAEALRKLRENKVDVLFTDIRMPKMDGLELLGHAKEENLCNAVILMSEYADFEYAREGIVKGAADYLVKPIDTVKLGLLMQRLQAQIEENENMNAEERDLGEAAIVLALRDGENIIRERIIQWENRCAALSQTTNDDIRIILIRRLRNIFSKLYKDYSWLKQFPCDIEVLFKNIANTDSPAKARTHAENIILEMAELIRSVYPSGKSAQSYKVMEFVLSHPYEQSL